jgi:hypothetical protein
VDSSVDKGCELRSCGFKEGACATTDELDRLAFELPLPRDIRIEHGLRAGPVRSMIEKDDTVIEEEMTPQVFRGRDGCDDERVQESRSNRSLTLEADPAGDPHRPPDGRTAAIQLEWTALPTGLRHRRRMISKHPPDSHHEQLARARVTQLF